LLAPNDDKDAASEQQVKKSADAVQKKKQLRRSNTEIEMSHPARLSHMLHRGLKLVSSDPTAKNKKDLEKMWQKTYLGMCNRAVVLNHAILKAEREEATVQPVSLLEIKGERGVQKSGSLDKHLIGLGRQFYSVHEVGEAESSTEELDMNSPKRPERVRGRAAAFPAFKTVVKEVPRTEEVDVSVDGGFVVRLHLRSRSIHAIQAVRAHCEAALRRGSDDKAVALASGRSLSLSQSSLSACSVASHDDPLLPQPPVKVGADDFMPCRRNSAIRKSLEPAKLKFPDPEIPVPGRSGCFRTAPSRSFSIQKVDVATQVNLGVCNFSRSESPDTRPVERAIEARSGSEDGLGSMVRCLHFSNTYIANRESNAVK
jgi:hypothetical protein